MLHLAEHAELVPLAVLVDLFHRLEDQRLRRKQVGQRTGIRIHVFHGKPAEVLEDCRVNLEIFGDCPGFVLLDGHNVAPETPLENLNTMVDYRFVRNYRADDGAADRGRNCTGKSGEDLVLPVPVGSTQHVPVEQAPSAAPTPPIASRWSSPATAWWRYKYEWGQGYCWQTESCIG